MVGDEEGPGLHGVFDELFKTELLGAPGKWPVVVDHLVLVVSRIGPDIRLGNTILADELGCNREGIFILFNTVDLKTELFGNEQHVADPATHIQKAGHGWRRLFPVESEETAGKAELGKDLSGVHGHERILAVGIVACFPGGVTAVKSDKPVDDVIKDIVFFVFHVSFG
ncbi:MAG: hypothetical protein KKE82_03895 [Proteobacteria bacterium]|nr:hypothetical protein [Pseudomonadota bacterium]MBU1545889.1 hypothetical protein [Pseudomonadota bacterium]